MSKVGNANKYAQVRAQRESRAAAQIAALMTHGFERIASHPTYLISAAGVIYSTHGRRVICLRLGVKPGGYEFVGLRNESGTKYEMVHRLVAKTFIPNPFDLPQVNHKDGNKRNNQVANLEWCTAQENIRHGLATGLIPTGLNHYGAKLNADQVRNIRSAPGRYRDIGSRFGVCAQTICNIKTNRNYKDVA